MVYRVLTVLLFTVYDVSKFMDEHPGGDEVLISEGGRDATDAFEDVGHSDDARALLKGMLKGDMDGYVSARPCRLVAVSCGVLISLPPTGLVEDLFGHQAKGQPGSTAEQQVRTRSQPVCLYGC